jgi:hypothetical protein
MWTVSRALGCFVLCAGLLSSELALGQGESKKNCGPGRRPGINGCVDASPRARPAPAPAKPASAPRPPAPDQGMRPPPDERTPAEAAERALLMRELKQLEALLKATPKDGPERAALLRRLAETYVELARRAELDREVARVRAERAAEAAKTEPKAPTRRPRTPTRL